MKKFVRFWKEFYEDVGIIPCAILGMVFVVLCLVIAFCVPHIVDELSIPSKQGTYTVEDDGEIQVYVNDKRYKYWVDPISGYVNLKELESSVTTNMTEEEFFKSLKDKGLRKEGD